jgi:hypothetical protein
MITKFKIFEDKEEYLVGDYVLINTKKAEKNIRLSYDDAYQEYKSLSRFWYAVDKKIGKIPGKITEIDLSSSSFSTIYIRIQFMNDREYFFSSDEIVRKLTPKEIKKFEMEKMTQKYNL